MVLEVVVILERRERTLMFLRVIRRMRGSPLAATQLNSACPRLIMVSRLECVEGSTAITPVSTATFSPP